MRYVVAFSVALLLAGAGYLGWMRFKATPEPPSTATPVVRAAPLAKRVVSSDGCGAGPPLVFTLTSASVGEVIEGKVGHMSACESNQTERVSGSIDWGDGTSSAVETGDLNGKDQGFVLAPKHAYKTSGTFPLFARIRVQCFDHGQSTRIIVCGSGTLEVR